MCAGLVCRVQVSRVRVCMHGGVLRASRAFVVVALTRGRATSLANCAVLVVLRGCAFVCVLVLVNGTHLVDVCMPVHGLVCRLQVSRARVCMHGVVLRAPHMRLLSWH